MWLELVRGWGWRQGSSTSMIDAAAEANARTRAEEGVERAKGAGLDAHARTRAQRTIVADAILADAAALGVSVIVHPRVGGAGHAACR
jgi:hypothetical protein